MATSTQLRRSRKILRVIISGGPGSGCTSTAKAVGGHFGLPVFDSDAYFHKPSNPPFQEQYTPEERRIMLASALETETSWILSGSIATWELNSLGLTHGVFLNTQKEARLDRLIIRQRNQFGTRIESEGDMQEEHQSFMEWAAGYEERTGPDRNLYADRAFLEAHCTQVLVLTGDKAMDEIVSQVVGFLADIINAEHVDQRISPTPVR